MGAMRAVDGAGLAETPAVHGVDAGKRAGPPGAIENRKKAGLAEA